jgi:hypothetical protein
MARTLDVYEVFELFEKATTRKDKIAVLKLHESWAIKDVIKGALDPKIEWLLPKGDVPYTACEAHSTPSTLLRKNKDFRYVVKGGTGGQMPAVKREKIFLGIVESIHPKDAELVCSMINKKLPVKGLTVKLVQEAYPELL